MHDLKEARPSPPGDSPASAGHPPVPDRHDPRSDGGAPPFGAPKPRARRGHRRAANVPIPPVERRRLAALDLRKAYGRIKADFSEAYELCRNDTQRNALERAHRAAREVYLRAIDERLFENREGWKAAQNAFRPERSRADRQLARLVAADAVTRILKRLAAIEAALVLLAD